jgi:hypothetical protein
LPQSLHRSIGVPMSLLSFVTLARMNLDAAQRVVLGLLIERAPAVLDIAELRCALPGVDGVERAVSCLAGDGLAYMAGDRVGATRAALRYYALDPV